MTDEGNSLESTNPDAPVTPVGTGRSGDWMPRLHINLVREPRRPSAGKWIVRVVGAALVVVLLCAGVQLGKHFLPAFRAAFAPAPVRPQPPTAASQPQPASAPLAAAPAKPQATPMALPSALPARATLLAVHHVSNSAGTAIELELNRPVELHAEALHDPERVFVDLLNTDIAPEMGSATGIITQDVSDARVQRVRVAGRGTATRVVLDLNCPCGYSYKMSQQPPYRLVVAVEKP